MSSVTLMWSWRDFVCPLVEDTNYFLNERLETGDFPLSLWPTLHPLPACIQGCWPLRRAPSDVPTLCLLVVLASRKHGQGSGSGRRVGGVLILPTLCLLQLGCFPPLGCSHQAALSEHLYSLRVLVRPLGSHNSLHSWVGILILLISLNLCLP